MVHALVKRRDEIMTRADRAVEAAWPQRKGETYLREMRTAVDVLQAIAAEMHTAGLNRVEQSRTYRHLGSVYADLEPAQGKEMLIKAKGAYQLAEDLLRGETDGLERAKLNFNYANTLRQLDPNDIRQLEEAKERFLAARVYFVKNAPQYIPQVDTALSSVTALLKIAPLAVTVAKNARDMQALEQELGGGGDVTQISVKMREIMGRDGGVAGMTGRVKGLVEGLQPSQEQGEAYAKVRQQLEELTKKVLTEGGVGREEQGILSALRARLESDRAAGGVEADRAETVRRLLDQLETALAGNEETPQEILDKLQKLRSLPGGWIEALHYPSYGVPRPASGTRAAALVELCWHLRRYLTEEMNQPGRGPDESKEALNLSVRASGADKRLYEAGADDARASIIDKEELRPLALAVREFSARHRLMLARPIWSAAKAPVDQTALFYSGAADTLPVLPSICRRLGLEILPHPAGARLGAARWIQLQKAMTAVFDLRTVPGAALSTVTYELGIAVTLGRPIVVIVGPRQTMPFDVDITPIEYGGGAQDDAVLESAIEQSLVWLYPKSPAVSSVATLDYILSQFPRPNANLYLDQTLRMLAELRREPDPVSVGRTVAQFVDFLNDGHTMLVHPAWQPIYPIGNEPRLFHVMPFRPKWAADVSRCAQAAVEAQDGLYIRGDMVSDPDVISSIWKEIAQATHVLVDLTGFNANVALELGIAHTLGREVLMVSQGQVDDHVFPSIGKLRVQTYDIQKLDQTLGKPLGGLFSSSRTEVSA